MPFSHFNCQPEHLFSPIGPGSDSHPAVCLRFDDHQAGLPAQVVRGGRQDRHLPPDPGSDGLARSPRLPLPAGQELRVQEEGGQGPHQRCHEPLAAAHL